MTAAPERLEHPSRGEMPGPRVPTGGPVLRGVGADAAWAYVGVVGTGLTSLLVPALALREVGASGFGLYAVVAAALSLIGPIDMGLSLGVSRSSARECSTRSGGDRRLERERIVASHSLYVAAAAALLATTLAVSLIVVLLAVSHPVASPAEVATLVALLGAAASVVLATAAYNGVLVGARCFRTASAGAVLGSVVTCAALPFALSVAGLPGIGVAVLLGTAASRWFLVARARRVAPWITLRAPRWADRRLREVAATAVPLVLLGIGTQVVATTDVLVIGALGSASAVGLYRAASLLPTQVVSFIYRGCDACFPALAQGDSEARQEAATSVLTRVTSLAAGIALGGAALLHADVVRLLVGHDSPLASSVLVLFAAIWCVNASVHGLALLLIARSQQRAFAPLVVAESVLNVVASILLVLLLGPVGAAWATLLTIAASNLVLLPLVARKHLSGSPFTLVLRNGLAFVALGVAVAAAVVGTVSAFPFHGAARLAVTGTGLAVAGAIAGAAVLAGNGRSAAVDAATEASRDAGTTRAPVVGAGALP